MLYDTFRTFVPMLEFPLTSMSLMGTKIVYNSGLLPKFKSLNRKAYWVLMALWMMDIKGKRIVNRTELVTWLDQHIGRVYPSDLSTILRRLAAERYIKYQKVGFGNKAFMQVNLLQRGGNAIWELELYLKETLNAFNRVG